MSPTAPTGHVFRVDRARGPVWYSKYRLPDGRHSRRSRSSMANPRVTCVTRRSLSRQTSTGTCVARECRSDRARAAERGVAVCCGYGVAWGLWACRIAKSRTPETRHWTRRIRRALERDIDGREVLVIAQDRIALSARRRYLLVDHDPAVHASPQPGCGRPVVQREPAQPRKRHSSRRAGE